MSCYSRAKLNLVRHDFSTAFETGLIILGDPGTASQDDMIFSGESLLQELFSSVQEYITSDMLLLLSQKRGVQADVIVYILHFSSFAHGFAYRSKHIIFCFLAVNGFQTVLNS